MKSEKVLGDHQVKPHRFSQLDAVFQRFESGEFKKMIDRQRSYLVNQALLELIQKEKEPCFLLPALIEFVERVDREKILHHYRLNSFELWLNQHSGLSQEENYRVRGKIAGKRIDRSDYQALFPIGSGKMYEGTHFVTAHKSPDLDTTVASFWGWLDAFAARVGNGMHVWNLPGGPPPAQIEVKWLFEDLFHPGVFSHVAQHRTALSLTGNDLMTQKALMRKQLSDPIAAIDHDRDNIAVVIVDDQGFYLGDWRHFDVEGVRQVILLLSSCLRWFENRLHLHLISQFAKKDLELDGISLSLTHLFNMKIKDCEPSHDFTRKQKKEVQDFLMKVLGMESGMEASFEELRHLFERNKMGAFVSQKELVEGLKDSHLFDAKGRFKEDRPGLFHYLEKVVEHLHASIQKIRTHLETIHVALKTKTDVFGHLPTFVSVRSDIEEIRAKMGTYSYLTVAYPDQGKFAPVGIIQASDVRKSALGTVSLRDFCNREEMSIPSYLEVISVIDHHKSTLSTFTAPTAIIADAQSCNTLVAKQAFLINDKYSKGGLSTQEIEKQISNEKNLPILQRLLTRKMAKSGEYFIHPDREYAEYLHFLHAILDDTDLLTKVSIIDLEVIEELLNRLKSLAEGKEVEIASLRDLPRNQNFLKEASQKLLQNKDLYSLYRKIYLHREKEIGETISLCAEGKPSFFFADTKEQNGCCRVGQTKIFASNVSLFEKKADGCRRAWLKEAMAAYKEKGELDLHIHMISTIVHAEEVYAGKEGHYSHKDELWIWIPEEEVAEQHLKRFLTSFQNCSGLRNNPIDATFSGKRAGELALLFEESFPSIARHVDKKSDLSIAILRYKPGTLNSRKAMITPFLPVAAS